MHPVQNTFTAIEMNPTDKAETNTAPKTAPHKVTTRRGENAAPRNVAKTISNKRVSSEPGEDPDPRASTNEDAIQPAKADNMNDATTK